MDEPVHRDPRRRDGRESIYFAHFRHQTRAGAGAESTTPEALPRAEESPARMRGTAARWSFPVFNSTLKPLAWACVSALAASIPTCVFSQSIRFAAPVAIPFPNDANYAPVALTTGDVNGDGNTDLLLFSQGIQSSWSYESQLTLLTGNGTGNFAAKTLAIQPHPFSQFLLADVNGDGHPDTLYIYGGYNTPPYPSYQGNVEIWTGDGTGNFSKTHSYPLPVGVVTAKLADFNSDGRMDLAVLTANSVDGSIAGSDTYLNIFTNLGNGTLQQTQSVHHAQAYEMLGPVADYSGDGKQDLILIGSSNNVFTMLPGIGNGTFTLPSSVTYTFSGMLIDSMASANLNGDKKQDLLVALQTPTGAAPWRIASLLAKQTSGFYWAGSRDIAAGLTYLELADLNGDGLVDDLNFNINSGAVRVLPGEGGLNFGPAEFVYNGHWGGVVLAPLKTGELPSIFFSGLTNASTGPGYLGVMPNVSK